MLVWTLSVLVVRVFVFFFFKQKTAYEMRISDWSSDVCSSDLLLAASRKRKCGDGECQTDLAVHRSIPSESAPSSSRCNRGLALSMNWREKSPSSACASS